MKRCKVCKAEFKPRLPMQKVCCIECAQALAQSDRIKKERKESIAARREAKQKLKSRADWMREAQAAFNAYIRARDAHLPCISCGRFHDGQWHAGHYLSVGARPELRFEELNVHKQCAPCNNHLSGNAVLYRKGLIAKIGADRVDWLEGSHKAKKYTVDELVQIKSAYKQKIKDMS